MNTTDYKRQLRGTTAHASEIGKPSPVLLRLAAAFDRAEWMDDGRCRGMNPDFFHPERGDNVGLRRAKAVCADCPVKALCLDHAMATKEKIGVWGGMSERERRALRESAA